MNVCPPPEHLERLLAQQLGVAEREELERHIEGCTPCQRVLRDLTNHTEFILGPQSAAPPLDARLKAELLLRLQETQPSLELSPEPGGEHEAGTEVPTPAEAAGQAGTTADLPALPAMAGYDILELIGRGGMGVVYKARQIHLNRLVALKMVLNVRYAGAEDLLRFRLEGETLADFQHPNIVQVYDVGAQNGCPFFSMEFVGGGSLAQKIARQPQRPAEAAALVETLARAIHTAHLRGIVHRDLKPANVLLTPQGIPKITDFGLAKRLNTGVGLSQSGDIMGTPSYMAPEQAGGKNKQIGPAVDIYALGAILYELLTGRPPFRADTPMDTVLQVLSEDPPPPSRIQPELPRDLVTICLKCLDKEPVKRYASAEVLAEDLRRFLDGRPITARPVGPGERAWKWARRRPALAGVLAALVLVVLGGLLGMTVLWQRAEGARAEAEGHQQRAESSYQMARKALEECIRTVADDPRVKSGPLEDLRRVVLQAEAQFYQEFIGLRGEEPAFQVERGWAYHRLARVTAQLGFAQEAIRHGRAARDIFQVLVDQHPAVAEYQFKLARSYNHLGNLHKETGQFQEAEQAYLKAVAHHAALKARYAMEPDYQVNLAGGYNNRGSSTGRPAGFPRLSKPFSKAWISKRIW
jgi:hypothetical protein